MSENTKRFKNFRNELTESEYREVLTGYPNRDIHTDDAVRFDEAMIARVNAMLNAISRSTFIHPGEAFIKIKTRLNILMLDFPWTPYLWQDTGVGTVTLTVTRYGRVDGIDAMTGAVRTDGKANNMDGFRQFTLVANIERAEDGLLRVTAKLQPMEIAVVEEDYQTPAREAEMKRKVEKHETAAQRGYEAKMTKTGKAAKKGRKQEDKHDAASRRLLKKDRKEQESARTYGRGGKLVKRGSRAEVKEPHPEIKEGVEQIDELLTPMRDKITSREIDKGLSDTSNTKLSDAQRKKAYARATRAQFARLRARSHDGTKYGASHTAKYKKENERWRKKEKSVKEEMEQVEEGIMGKIAKKVQRAKQAVTMQTGSDPVHPQDRLERLHSQRAGKNAARAWRKKQQMKEAAGQEATAKKVVDNSKKIKGLVGGQKRLDVNNNNRLDSQDFKMLRAKKKPMQEGLVGGQKKLDINKNKRLDSQDFAMLRAKKKPMKEDNTTYVGNIALQQPDPTNAVADQSSRGKRFHKKAIKSVEEAVKKATMKQKKPKIDPGARHVHGQQKAIKKRLDQYGSSW